MGKALYSLVIIFFLEKFDSLNLPLLGSGGVIGHSLFIKLFNLCGHLTRIKEHLLGDHMDKSQLLPVSLDKVPLLIEIIIDNDSVLGPGNNHIEKLQFYTQE